MNYMITIDNPTPDVLRQVWFSAMQIEKDMKGELPNPTSKDGGRMKITVTIFEAESNVIAGLGKVVTLINSEEVKEVAKPVPPPQKKKPTRNHKWGKHAVEQMYKKSPEAPWGLKVDGTPRKKPGKDETLGSAFYKLFKDDIK